MTAFPSIPFPLDFASVYAEHELALLGAAEMGCVYWLCRSAWSRVPPCTLPACDTALATFARAPLELWTAARGRVLLVLAPELVRPDVWSLPQLERAYARAVDRLDTNRARTARATAVRLGRERPPDPTSRQRDVNVTSTSRARDVAALSLRSEFSSPALSLQRSSPELNSERPADRPEEREICAILGDGARAILTAKAAEWRRRHVIDMLHRAIQRWTAVGRTTFPLSRVTEIAHGTHATPARVEALIEQADAVIAAGTLRSSVIGLVLTGLCQTDRTQNQRPHEVLPLQAKAWDDREAQYLALLRAQAAIDAKNHAARAAARPTTETAS